MISGASGDAHSVGSLLDLRYFRAPSGWGEIRCPRERSMRWEAVGGCCDSRFGVRKRTDQNSRRHALLLIHARPRTQRAHCPLRRRRSRNRRVRAESPPKREPVKSWGIGKCLILMVGTGRFELPRLGFTSHPRRPDLAASAALLSNWGARGRQSDGLVRAQPDWI